MKTSCGCKFTGRKQHLCPKAIRLRDTTVAKHTKKNEFAFNYHLGKAVSEQSFGIDWVKKNLT